MQAKYREHVTSSECFISEATLRMWITFGIFTIIVKNIFEYASLLKFPTSFIRSHVLDKISGVVTLVPIIY
jgi:hypothetical protein